MLDSKLVRTILPNFIKLDSKICDIVLKQYHVAKRKITLIQHLFLINVYMNVEQVAKYRGSGEFIVTQSVNCRSLHLTIPVPLGTTPE